jgi:transcriptional regulator with XRE-family HTH domain
MVRLSLAEFGKLVRARRMAKGLSQEALAASALKNADRKGYISQIENGRLPRITPLTAKKIAKELEFSQAEIDAVLGVLGVAAPEATQPTSSDYKILSYNQLAGLGLSLNDILERISALDYQLYTGVSPDNVGDVPQWVEIYKQNPNNWRVLFHNDDVVGYWQTAVFLSDFYSSVVLNGKMMEGELTPEDYDFMEIEGVYNLYFISTCLSRLHRNPRARLMLMDAFFQLSMSFASGMSTSRKWLRTRILRKAYN